MGRVTKKIIWAKIREIFQNITIEPAFFIFSLSQGLYLIVRSELYITKVCNVNLAYGEEICDNIQEHKEEQVEVQKYVSTLKIYGSILQAIPSVLFALFAGPWSDKFGRKGLLICSLWGFVLNNGVFMINTYWFYELKAEYLLLECLNDLFGGYVVFFMASSAYIADVTLKENRTKRAAFMTGLWPIGFNLGRALSGVLKTKLGFVYNFGFGMILSTVAMFYVIFFVEDSFKILNSRVKDEESPSKTDPNDNTQSHFHKFKSLFDIKNIKQGFKTVIKKRDYNLRLYIILIIICFELEMFINIGEWNNTYLYLRRQLNFTITDFTRYTTIVGVVGIVTQYITIPIMSEKFKFHDSTIVLLNITGNIFNMIAIGLATAEWMLYVGTAAAFLEGSSYSLFRCMISKNVEPDEVGKIFSIIGSIQAFLPMVANPFFGMIYKSTVASFPQTFIIVIIGLFCIDWVILIFLDRGMRTIGKSCEVKIKKENQQKLETNVKEASNGVN